MVHTHLTIFITKGIIPVIRIVVMIIRNTIIIELKVRRIGNLIIDHISSWLFALINVNISGIMIILSIISFEWIPYRAYERFFCFLYA